MKKNLQECIAQIQEMLNASSGQQSWNNENEVDIASELLWNILAALRGPDNMDAPSSIKEATTCVIRYHFLGRKDSNQQSFWGSLIYQDSQNLVDIRLKLLDDPGPAGTHFVHHARKAFIALGLDWNNLNT